MPADIVGYMQRVRESATTENAVLLQMATCDMSIVALLLLKTMSKLQVLSQML